MCPYQNSWFHFLLLLSGIFLDLHLLNSFLTGARYRKKLQDYNCYHARICSVLHLISCLVDFVQCSNCTLILLQILITEISCLWREKSQICTCLCQILQLCLEYFHLHFLRYIYICVSIYISIYMCEKENTNPWEVPGSLWSWSIIFSSKYTATTSHLPQYF